MNHTPKSITNLVNQFSKLPGIGQKTASRLTYYLLRKAPQEVQQFGQALIDLQKKLIFCSECYNYTEDNPCLICSDTSRDNHILCVVEQPLDIIALEKTGYKGIYHVLHGALAPIEGIGPEHLTLENLQKRIETKEIKEIIIATNPNLEGEATFIYIQNMFKNKSIKISRLAFGLPVGSDLEYADEITLTKAMEGRK